MQATATTPLLGHQRLRASSDAGSELHHAVLDTRNSQEQLERQIQHRESSNTLLRDEDAAPVRGGLKTQPVLDGHIEVTPPGCGTALFLVLLFSLFFANIEGSLLLATHVPIASDLGQRSQSQWLIVTYSLAAAASQPVIGNLSNVVGRKRLLLICYGIFASAAAVCGVAPNFTSFVIGRVLAGLGGSGMDTMVNLNVSGLVGLKDLASYRSYIQATMASARLLGGPLGGLLVERLGWRIVFTAQSPILLLAAMLCAVLLPATPVPASAGHGDDIQLDAVRPNRIWSTLQQIDIGGAFLLVLTITLGLIALVFYGDGYTAVDFRVSLALGFCLVCGSALILFECFIVPQPMLSRRLLTDLVVIGIYLIGVLGNMAQSALAFILPLEERILFDATDDRAGLQLIPLVIGNVCGGILAAMLIKRSNDLVRLCSAAMITNLFARAATYLFWYSMGPVVRTLPLLVTGLSSSIVFATAFIHLNVQITKADQAMGISSLFCLYGIGAAVGTTASKVVTNFILRARLTHQLDNHAPSSTKIIASLMGDHHLVNQLPPEVYAIVQQSIRDSFSASRAFSAAAQLATVPCILFLRPRLPKSTL